ncbi:anion exchange protein 4 [Eublepharis macularius]|uniref:Anion exchange protein n=1 Tax=Eublepharis macularius TaxID=481883 RepID=A0AA97L3Q7_EUBMA|nr:anion exchange protein 4 [Eublepharis macularius]
MSKAKRAEAPEDRLPEDPVPPAELRSNGSRADGEPASRNSVVICQAVGRSIFTSSISSAAERVSLMLKQEEEEEEASHPVLFIQLSELFSTPEGLEWRQTARWIKFEEKVEDGGERWSKPHVTTLSLHSLFELRTCIRKGAVLLDLEAGSFQQIVEKVIETQIEKHALKPELMKKLRYVLLLRPKHHATRPQLKVLLERGLASCFDKADSPSDAGSEVLDKPLKEQLKNRFKTKIPAGAEVANILVGEAGFLEKPLIAFVRLQDSVFLGGLTEVAFPSRFLFILLGPRAKVKAYHEIGRAAATLLTDELFQRVARKAQGTEDLVAGIDEFLDELTILPPGKWDPTIRIAPPKCLPSPQKRISMHFREWGPHSNGNVSAMEERHLHGHQNASEELKRTGRLFGGLVKDIQRKASWYCSDFYDAVNIQCFSATLYIYLATVTNAITFGGMLGDATENMQGVLESFLGTAIAGAFFCLCAGQPLTILSSTGPVLVFERLLYSFSKDYSLDYLEFRLWIGLWVAFFGLILVATEASYLVQYFTRFTEEGFCALISFIFIYDAVKKMLSLADHYPINWDYKISNVPLYSCTCNGPERGNSSLRNETLFTASRSFGEQIHLDSGNWSLLAKDECVQLGGHLVGNSCNYVPDITFMSFILFLGTFLCSMTLKSFKTSRYFPTTLRRLVSDFAIILAILVFCGIDAVLGLETPKLIVPSEFKPTNPTRGWVVPPFGANPWWICLASSVPAVLVIILIFMDQQITAVILNRKEYKLQKGAGFHLDFFCVSLLMILTSVMGLPWYVSATVISLAHMDSLKKESNTRAPGEQPKFLGIREQRVTGLMVFLLTGLSVFLAPVLKFIPMPVLYGIFLYMGVSALSSIQLTDRLQLLLMPAKHQPDFIYLRHVPLRRVHLFTLIQILCLTVLWILKSTEAAIIFPLMLLALVGIRKAMECIFSLHDLGWLDDIIPEKDRKEEEEKLKRKQDLDESDSEDSERMYQEKGPEINISVN